MVSALYISLLITIIAFDSCIFYERIELIERFLSNFLYIPAGYISAFLKNFNIEFSENFLDPDLNIPSRIYFVISTGIIYLIVSLVKRMKGDEMFTKKFALGLGIAIIFPMLIYYSIVTINPEPKYEHYEIKNYSKLLKKATPDEKARLEEESSQLSKKRAKDEEFFKMRLFLSATIAGIVALIISAVISVRVIGIGLIFGGIITVIGSFFSYWEELQDWMRAISLLVTFIICIFIGYRKFSVEMNKTE